MEWIFHKNYVWVKAPREIDADSEILDIPLNDDELQVISYLEKNKFINNSICRKELGFSKDRALRTFNGLVQKDKVVKTGAGSKTRYILIEEINDFASKWKSVALINNFFASKQYY